MANKANQTTEPKEVTMHELVAAFEGKHVNIIPNDFYQHDKSYIGMRRG